MREIPMLSPPPTLNTLPSRQRARLLRSTRKLAAVLGAQPILLEVADPYDARQSRSTSNLHDLLPIGVSRGRSASPSPVPDRPTKKVSDLKKDLRQPRSFSASAQTRRQRSGVPQPLVLAVQAVHVDRSDPRLLGGRSKSPLQPSFAANTPRRVSHASTMSTSSAMTLSGSPSATPLTPNFRFRAHEIAAERRKKMARIANKLGENVPPELVFPEQFVLTDKKFRDEDSSSDVDDVKFVVREANAEHIADAENFERERESMEWLLLERRNGSFDEEEYDCTPSPSPTRMGHLRARSASPNLPSSSTPFTQFFPRTSSPAQEEVSTPLSTSMNSARVSEAEVALAGVRDPFSEMVPATPPATKLTAVPPPSSSPSVTPNVKRLSRGHNRRSASLSHLAHPLQMHLELGVGGGKWQPPAEWAVGPSTPTITTTETPGRSSADDIYVTRAASLDGMLASPRSPGRAFPAYTSPNGGGTLMGKRAPMPRTRIWAEVEAVGVKRSATTSARREGERAVKKGKGKKEGSNVLDHLRALRR